MYAGPAGVRFVSAFFAPLSLACSRAGRTYCKTNGCAAQCGED
jgi:hypothetical protein